MLYQWTQAAVSCVGFQSGWFPSNVARNSRAHISDIEMWPLKLQRLWPISKNDRVKLRATFGGGGYRRHSRAPLPAAGTAAWRPGALSISSVTIRPLCNVLESGGDGGFAALGGFCRRVAGVSRL